MADSSAETSDSRYPLEVLIIQFIDHNIQLRIKALSILPNIAMSLGPERTCSHLIPFLAERIDDEEEEWLSTLAKQLGSLINFVGNPQNINCLIKPLVSLCCAESTAVRFSAMEAIRIILTQTTDKYLDDGVIALFESSSKNELSRASACTLIPVCYSRVSNRRKQQLRKIFEDMCIDATLTVRLAAASILGELSQVVDEHCRNIYICKCFTILSKDIHHSVRTLAVESCVIISYLLNDQNIETCIMAVLHDCAGDTSSKVRHMVSSKLTELRSAKLGNKTTIKTIDKIVRTKRIKEREETLKKFGIKDEADLQVEIVTSSSDTSPDKIPLIPKLLQGKRKNRGNISHTSVKSKRMSNWASEYKTITQICRRLVPETPNISIAILFLAGYGSIGSLAKIKDVTLVSIQNCILKNVDRLKGVNEDAYSHFKENESDFQIDVGDRANIMTIAEKAKNSLNQPNE